MPSTSESPVIIIGAGLAGLAASLSLARAGHRTLVLEASESVGGCCSNMRDSGFTFNNGAIYVAVPSLLRSSFRRLGLDFDREVPLTGIEHPHVTFLDDGTVIGLSSIDASYVDGPSGPARTDALRNGLHALQRRWGPVYRTLVEEILPFEPSLLRTLARLWRYLPRMGGTVDRLIASHFPDSGLQAAVASTLLYTGIPPERLPATQIIGLLALLEEGFHLPRAGMGAISEALFRALEQHGGAVRIGARVEGIELSAGRVAGVTLSDGEHIATSRIIATCSGFDVVHRLLPEDTLPARLTKTARRAPLSHRAIAIQLGCSGAHLPRAFIVNHVPPMSQQGRMHSSSDTMPRWLSYTHPTAVNRDMAPSGKAIIECFAPVSGVASADEWTPAMTDRTVDNHVAALKARLPGLTVETRRVLDPRDFARDRHLYEGALYGIAPGTTPDKLFPHRTPVQGLHLAGQTTFPGYGVPSAILSGIQAAEGLARET